MCYTHDKKRPAKRLLQKYYAESAHKILNKPRINAIVLAGLELEYQLELYNGFCISFESKKATYMKQQRYMQENELINKRIKTLKGSLGAGLRRLNKMKAGTIFDVLDRDFTSALYTPLTLAKRQEELFNDINEFSKIARNKFIVTLTFCLDQRAFGHAYARDQKLPATGQKEFLATKTAKAINEVMQKLNAKPVFNDIIDKTQSISSNYFISNDIVTQYHTYRDTKNQMIMQQWLLEKQK